MKVLERYDLLKLIYFSKIQKFDLRDFDSLLDKFGDDYCLIDGKWTKVVENQERKGHIRLKEEGEG